MATPSSFGGRLTYDDLARMPEDGMRHEIIDAADGSFPEVQSLPSDAQSLTTPLLPGFSLSLERLFRP